MPRTRRVHDELTLELSGPARLLLPGGLSRGLDGLGALLAARVALRGRESRAELAPLLWPDVDEARARANLRQRLLRLRALAGREWITGDAELQLAADVRVALEGDGELLPGIDTTPVAEALQQWLEGARRERQLRRREALARQADAAEAAGDPAGALSAAEHLLALEPYSEAAHRRLVRQHYLQGDSGAAARAAQACEAMLRREFGAAPGPESRSLFALVARAAEAGPAAAPATLALPIALLRPPRMVARDAEHAALRAAVARGDPALVLGEAGMGKSRLLAELAGGLPASQVALVKAQPGDGGVPYATLLRLLHSAGVAASTASADLGWAPPSSGGTGGDAAHRIELAQSVTVRLADRGVAWVLLDDLHFADPATLETVQALADGSADAAASPRLGWVFAQRPAEAGSASRSLVDVLEEGGRLQRIELSPLEPAAMAVLLRDVGLPEPEAAALAGPLARHCGGNPLFALETLKQMPPGTTGVRALPQPSSVSALIGRRLRQLSPAALALARAAAVAGPDFGPALAEAVLARPALDLADAWAELEAGQVLRGGAFAHDLVYDAAARSIPQPIAAHLHAAVAVWLEARDGEPARVAAHWQGAGDETRARPWLVRAGERAEQGLRMGEAAAFYEQAAAIVPGADEGADRHTLLLRAARARQTAHGNEAALPAYREALAAAGSAAQHVATATSLRTVLDECGRFDEGRRVGLEALARAEAAQDETLVARVLFGVVGSMASLGENAEAEVLIDRHWALWKRVEPDNPMVPGTRAMVLDGLGRTDEARAFHEEASRLMAHEPVLANHLAFLGNHALNRMDAGDLEAADALLARAAAIEAGHEDLVSKGQARHRAAVARDRAQVRRALEEFDRAEQAERRSGGGILLLTMVRLHRAALWCHLGQWARALRDLPAATGETMPPWMGLRAQQLRMRISQGTGAAPPAVEWPDHTTLMRMGNPPLGCSIRLDLALWAADPAAAPAAQEACAAVEAEAAIRGMWGAMWAARLHGAHCALRAGDRAQARHWALACADREAAVTPLDLWDGRWWHTLWRVWQRLGDRPRAEAAHAEGRAWVLRMLQRELEPAFHAGFRQLPECRELLLGAP